MLAATAAGINCVGGVNGDNPTELTLSDINVVIQSLLSNDARTFLSGVGGENKFGTAPVRDAFFALCHTDLQSDLQNVAGFISKWNYPNQNETLYSEWGAVNNLRFLISSVGSISGFSSNLGANVYNVFCVGRESYACIKQNGFSARFIYHPAYLDGPLELNVSVGYKFAEVPRITNDAWIFNLRCTLST